MAPQGGAETSQENHTILMKNLLLYTMYGIVALIGSRGQWPSRLREPPVEKVGNCCVKAEMESILEVVNLETFLRFITGLNQFCSPVYTKPCAVKRSFAHSI